MTETVSRAADSAPSPTPRRLAGPSWLDLRLIGGVVLVLLAVLIGATVVSGADRRQARWAVSRDVAAGTVLTAADLRPVRVQLGAADGGYLPASEPLVGRTLQHSLQDGQLVPRSEVTAPATGVTVTIALRPENAPWIEQGDRVTVWLSTKTCQGVVLLSGVPVQRSDKVSGSAFGTDAGSLLVVRVSADDARRVVSALDLDGAVIRAGLLSAGQPAEPVAESLAACHPATR